MGNGIDLRVHIGGLEWKNPVTTASGTFSPRDSGEFYDFTRLGAVTTKGVSAEPWEGNPPPRIAEAWGGMLNAVGLQNPGVDAYILEELSFLLDQGTREAGTRIIANVAGKSVEEYAAVIERLEESAADMIELNISCPNIREGGVGFGTAPAMAALVTREARRVCTKPLIVKLTPNVTDISEIARAVEAEGADAVSLINTLLGMKIDLKNRRPLLGNRMGGLSGPAVKPVALRMVYQVRRAVGIPIIGMGGVMSGEDAAQFIMAGADAVAVGTAALINPTASIDVLEGLTAFMEENGYQSVRELQEAFME